jgi:copper homeostasis protein
MSRILLEVCVDDAAGIRAAVDGGADRIELCAALALGGLTPSVGLMRLAAEAGVPTMAMIRPRAGDFVWSPEERRAMLAEIAGARAAGLQGVVIGASRPDGSLDGETLAELMAAASGLDVTLHRAIDLVPDVDAAIQLCHALGLTRVLSSGGAQVACDGLDRLSRLAEAGFVVMPGGGVSAETIGLLATRLPLAEVHASCSDVQAPPEDPRIAAFGFQPSRARQTVSGRVRALRRALDRIATERDGS